MNDSAAIPAAPDVVVAGCGPVGLVMAGLLGVAGVRTLVVERNRATSDEAKAISVDDESLRVLQRAGLADDVYPILQPGTGTQYFGADGRPLVHARGRRPYLLGHPFKSPFAQPDLERVLLDAVSRLPSVDVRFRTELLGLDQDSSGVTARLGLPNGPVATVRARVLVGCDGGRSTVRRELGIRMVGESFDDVWLVADTVRDPHRQRYAMHHGDPRRPHVIVPGRDGRCRYEMKLTRDEAAPGGPDPLVLAVRLIGAHRDVTVADVERCTTYRFHALVAERWRCGRVLLAGDAAHMMPPFAGQGLNSGVRDADNLSWKLGAVLDGRASPDLLDTYEAERRPHAQAMVDLSVRLGRVVMTSDRRVAAARDVALRAATRVPRFRRYLAEARFKPAAVYREGFVVPAPTLGPGHRGRQGAGDLVGRMLPQPRVLTAAGGLALLDDVLGPGFALVGVGCADEDWRAVAVSPLAGLECRCVQVALGDTMAEDGDGRRGVADVDGSLEAALAPVRGAMLLVRPDRFVAACWRGGEVGPAVAALARYLAPPGGTGEVRTSPGDRWEAAPAP